MAEGDLALLFVASEERDGAGMKAANNSSLAWDAVIFGEPTDGKLISGNTGALVYEITAHAAEAPEEAIRTIEEVIKGVDPRLQVKSGYLLPPVECDTDVDDEWCGTMRMADHRSTNEAIGFETAIMPRGTDVPNLEGSHKKYLYGPGSVLTAHTADEHVEVDDLTAAVEGYEKLVKAALGR
ncbi:hypothetical protein MMC15_006677 [Xylographa vitiligo]|nr:hypothetical protein [Xylographa vitiligo]